MDSSPPRTRTLEPGLPSPTKASSGVKRPAPSLLPAFEPLSSSPALPRPVKRQAISNAYTKYPTPVPTSSTGILSSSPSRVNAPAARPMLQRTLSSVSERAPLSAVPSIELNENGEALLMGRSSNSSHYQLSANRLISRVHVRARYISTAATDTVQPPLEPLGRVEIVCCGWNGLKLHCQSRTWELAKGDTFTSETEGAEIMIDVQDARVLVRWPRKDRDPLGGSLSDSSWDESPRSRTGAGTVAGGVGAGSVGASGLPHGSPLRRSTRIESPESPTPANGPSGGSGLHDLLSEADDAAGAVQIYEDASADEQELPKMSAHAASLSQSQITEPANSFSSDLSDPHSDGENDPDEENDPIVHSFGPFGANLSNRLASFSTVSPKRPYISRLSSGESNSAVSGTPTETHPTSKPDSKPASLQASPKVSLSITKVTTMTAVTATTIALAAESTTPALPPLDQAVSAAIANHVINQLAFSRLSSNPLTGILVNLPEKERASGGRGGGVLTTDELREIVASIPCIGTIPRQGKDAAGKPLESEYYYVPELDTDEHRRLAVTDGLRKPSLRNCRKQHKQYYWKRPRTP